MFAHSIIPVTKAAGRRTTVRPCLFKYAVLAHFHPLSRSPSPTPGSRTEGREVVDFTLSPHVRELTLEELPGSNIRTSLSCTGNLSGEGQKSFGGSPWLFALSATSADVCAFARQGRRRLSATRSLLYSSLFRSPTPCHPPQIIASRSLKRVRRSSCRATSHFGTFLKTYAPSS